MLNDRRSRVVRLGVTNACALLYALAGVQIAHAQSSVTLYGALDASILYTNKNLNKTTGGNSGSAVAFTDSGQEPSRFGLRGVEDLGGNMKAIFTLESGFSTANGGLGNSNWNFFGRQAFVGISGDYGTVTAGLQYSPFVVAQFESDPRALMGFASLLEISSAFVGVTGGYNSNAIVYKSPRIAGLQGSAMLALGGQAGDFQAGRQYAGSLIYQAHELLLTAALYSGNPGGSASGSIPPSTVSFFGRNLGASYKFGKLTVKAAFNSYNIQQSFNAYIYSAGLSYAITPGLFIDGAGYEVRDENNPNNHALVAASSLEYLISKKTTVYTQVGFVNNHGKMPIGLSNNNALNGVVGMTTGVSAGIRHVF
jgi:predicted porin